MALDTDGITVVDQLEDIRGARFHDGVEATRDLPGTPVIVRAANGWATVLLVVQDMVRGSPIGPPRCVLTRWRKAGGAWRRALTFRIRVEDLQTAADVAAAVTAPCGSNTAR